MCLAERWFSYNNSCVSDIHDFSGKCITRLKTQHNISAAGNAIRIIKFTFKIFRFSTALNKHKISRFKIDATFIRKC